MTALKTAGGAMTPSCGRSRKALIFSDLSTCIPAKALAARLKKGCWKVIPYEAGTIRGKMIWAAEESFAPAVRFQLNTKGWHAIYVGLFDRMPQGKVWLKLEGDLAPQPFATGVGRTHDGGIEEVFFKAACLDDSSIEISQQTTGFPACAGVAYIKLVPLSKPEIASIEKDRATKSNRRLVTTIDGFSFIHFRRPTTREEILKEIEVYRNTDFGTLILQYGGSDHSNYPSKHGNMFGQGVEVFIRKGDRYYSEAVQALARKKINPTKTLIEGARRIGIKVLIGMRLGWTTYEPWRGIFESSFYAKNPKWRCRDSDGSEVTRMSWAVPEVRRHLIEKLREAVRFGGDGVSILFHRGVPVVLYEEPFIKIFKQRHGKDPRAVNESDQRILSLRAEIVTTFFRELRAMLDGEAEKRFSFTPGEFNSGRAGQPVPPSGSVGQSASGGLPLKKLEISAVVFGSEKNNLLYGIDLRGLAEQSLIDEVYPIRTGNGFGSDTMVFEASFFRRLFEKYGIPFRPFIWTGGCRESNYRDWIKQVRSIYHEGANGILFWDANQHLSEWMPRSIWLKIARLGHLEEFRKKGKLAPPKRMYIGFHKLGDIIMDGRYPAYWGT